MAETLTTPDGKPVDIPDAVQVAQRDFAAAMAADTPAEVPPPPKRAERPETDDKPKARRGRPPKAARAAESGSKPSGNKATAVAKADYTKDAQAAVGMIWGALASLPPTQPLAFVLNANADALTPALAEGAKHSETIRRFVSAGENSWKLQLLAVAGNMAVQTMQVLRDPELREQARQATQEQLREAMRAQGIQVPEQAQDAGQPQA